MLIGAAFGRDQFGRVMGLMSPFTTALSLPAAPLVGWAFDRTGSYDPAFAVLPIVFVLAGASLALLRLPRPAVAELPRASD